MKRGLPGGAMVAAALALGGGFATAAEIVVTEAGDALHAQGCAATGRPPCSLRDAITRANASPGPDKIAFAIGSGLVSIRPASPLPPITDPVVLDGGTQPGFDGFPLVELDGSGAGEDAAGLRITAGGSTVRALAVNRFHAGALAAIVLTDKGGNHLEGNFVGTDPAGAVARGNRGHGILVRSDGNTIGGPGPGQGNLVSGNSGDGLRIQGARNFVEGNRIGTVAAGDAPLANGGDGVVASGGNTIGGTSPGTQNLVSGNTGVGIAAGTSETILGNLVGTDAEGRSAVGNGKEGIRGGGRIGSPEGTRRNGPCTGGCNLVSGNGGPGIAPGAGAAVAGNFIGTDASGAVAVPNSGAGVSVEGAARVTVGGSTPAARNLISGNGGPGVDLSADTEGAQIVGNTIGPDVSGAAGLPNAAGVVARSGARRNRIGGNSTTEGNRIAFNAGAGVEIQSSAGGGNAILGNSIFENGALGIDLGGDGVTLNRALEADAGPNTPGNFPVLVSVTPFSVEGTLDSAPSTTYTLELFASVSCDPSGYGQGESLIGITTFSTDTIGHASFGVSLTAPPGQAVTATSTDAAGNTSEFSACVLVEGEPQEGESPD